jgi:hypothetical protein
MDKIVDTTRDSREIVEVEAEGSSVSVVVASGLKVSFGRYWRIASSSRAHSFRLTSKICTVSWMILRSVQPRGVSGEGTTCLLD